MVIGSSGTFDTPIPADECGRRLDSDRSGPYVGYANGSGFELSRYGRTAVRVRGTFTSIAAGSRVRYRIELIPWIVWTLVLSYVVGIPVLGILALRGLLPPSVFIWLVVITAIVLPINAWFSERQAQRLRDYVTGVLNAN
jgi:hypothetical protein